jgi:Zn-dependent metalloprotease
MGAMCERWSDGGVNPNTWYIGEQIYTPGIGDDAMRYLNDPDRGGGSDYYGEDPDADVHVNSGIANLAYYLAVTGGLHPKHPSNSVTPLSSDPNLSATMGQQISGWKFARRESDQSSAWRGSLTPERERPARRR